MILRLMDIIVPDVCEDCLHQSYGTCQNQRVNGEGRGRPVVDCLEVVDLHDKRCDGWERDSECETVEVERS